MTDLPAEVPVLIVGGGPVGLGLAIELGWRGVECLLVEQGDGTIDLPRANAIDLRTMETCRRWGIAETVRNAGIPAEFPHTGIYVTGLTGYEIARFERRSHGGSGGLDISPERPQRCNQLFFDPVLRAHALSLASVSIRFRCRFESFAQDEAGVSAEILDLNTEERHTVRASYLVACCGGRSPIREILGMKLTTEGILGYPISIFFRAEDLWTYHDKGPASLNFMVGADGVWGTLIPLDGKALWRLTVHGSKDHQAPGDIDADAYVRKAIGSDAPYELLQVGAWTRREMVAEKFRVDRVFLAGDCAHQNSPTGGYGMNTGIGDAVDLGWKLAAVLEGWGGAGLLESYEAERRPVALRNVREATGNYQRRAWKPGPAVFEDGEEGDRVRAELGARIREQNARQHRGHGIALGHIYGASPICVYDCEGPAPDTVQDYEQTSYPGARAPHGVIADGRSTLDLFGWGFILLALGPSPPEVAALVEAADKRHLPLTVTAIENRDIAALYGRRLVMIRPDGHVAWRGDEMPKDPLAVIDRVRGAVP
ncbi:MAG: FAD-dependent monooxygenase [Gammaproteobacteria bacterium]|nr:FAD-dependent monooxygenase [Gammaproteobacteria bacterium]